MNITVAVDVREDAEEVVDAALPWAARLGGELDLVFAEGAFEESAAAEHKRVERRLRSLDTLMERVPEPMRGDKTLLTGRALDMLPTAAANLLVVATHGRRGFRRFWLGSVAERVVAIAEAPVLVLPHAPERATPAAGPLRVLVPVDFSAQVAAMMDKLGVLGDVELHLAHILPPPLYVYGSTEAVEPTMMSPEDIAGEETECTSALQSWCAERGIEGQLHVRRAMDGSTGHAIQELASELSAHLIMLPTTGRTSLAKLLMGSVASRVVRASPVPVWVFPKGTLEG